MGIDVIVVDHGNNLYLAPEAANHQAYNEKVDIYSFGVILRLLLTGKAEPPPPPPQVEEEGTVIDMNGSMDSSKLASIEPDRVKTTTPMQLLIGETFIAGPIKLIYIHYMVLTDPYIPDQCTTSDYYLRPSSAVILRQLKDELEALAQSNSLSGMVLSWSLRQGRAMTTGISRMFRAEQVN